MEIIFEDEDIFIIDKPAGLITISDNGTKTTLAALIQKEYGIIPGVSIVHRLDKETSGVMVVAKNKSAHDNLQNQFKDRQVKKEYLALVHGLVEKSGIVDVSLGRIPGGGNRFIATEEGRLAQTKYQPLEVRIIDEKSVKKITDRGNYGVFTLLKCKPLTGRTHQIRVHLKYINHPIVSDKSYAGRKTYKLDLEWCPRLFLHAQKIGFYHPVSSDWVEYESSLPEDLRKVLNSLTEYVT